MVEGAWALTSGTWAQILTPPYGHTVVSGLSLCFSEPQFPHASVSPPVPWSRLSWGCRGCCPQCLSSGEGSAGVRPLASAA